MFCFQQAHPKYLSCIATCCFYIAARTVEANVFIPTATELIKLSQCGGSSSDLARMERLILDKLQWQINAIAPLTFLQVFYELLIHPKIKTGESLLNSLIAKLEVLMCHFEFTKFRVSGVKCQKYILKTCPINLCIHVSKICKKSLQFLCHCTYQY